MEDKMNGSGHVLELLAADGPSSVDQDRLMQFGQFVGSWKLDVSYYDADGNEDRATAEWHWDWILGGRAILDVLVLPPRPSAPLTDGYHTTLRVFDKSRDLWKIVWLAPQFAMVYRLSGSFSDDGSVTLHGDPGDDVDPTRWVFSDVTPDSFLWEGFTKDAPEGDWRIDQRMTARRTA